MFKCMTRVLFLTILVGSGLVLAQPQARSLTLEECLISALKNNLNVAVQVLNPELSGFSVQLAQEKFLPSLSFGFRKNSNKNFTKSSFFKTNYFTFTVRI